MNKDRKKILTTFGMILGAVLILLVLAKISGYLSIVIPSLPASVYNGQTLPEPNQCATLSGTSITCTGLMEGTALGNVASTSYSYIYPYEYCVGVPQSTGAGIEEICPNPGFSSTINPAIYIAVSANTSSITASNDNDYTQIAAFSLLENQTEATLNSGSLPSTGNPPIASVYQAGVSAMQMQISILKAAIVYNNALASNTTAATTTIPVQQQAPPSCNCAVSIWSSIQTSLSSFIQFIVSNIQSYFSVPNLLSIGVSGTSGANLSYVGHQLNFSAQLTLNSNNVSTPYVVGSSRIVNTQCVSYVLQNSTKAFVYQSAITNQTTPSYVKNFSFTPEQTGIFIAGASCVSASTTFSNGAWSAWSTPVVIAQSNRALDIVALNVSITPPPNPVSISTSNISVLVVNYINGIIASIENGIGSLIKGL